MNQDFESMSTKEEKRSKLINSVRAQFCIYGDQFSRETIKKWFSDFLILEPIRMTASGRPSKYRSRKYKQETFFEWLSDESFNSWDIEQLDPVMNFTHMIGTSTHSDSCEFYTTFPKKVWLDRKEEILRKFGSVFMESGACFGFIVNHFDHIIVQNPQSVRKYIDFEVDDDDYIGIKNIPLKDPLTPYDSPRVDKNYLPGHVEHLYSYLTFTSAPYMWVGPDFYTFFPKEKLESYDDCVENTEIAQGYRRICLWDSIEEYNHPVLRERQWSFRRNISMDKILPELRSKPIIYKDQNSKLDPDMEFKKGKFEHGGELLAIFYVDNKNRPVSKSKATACIQREMSGNTIVWQERKKL